MDWVVTKEIGGGESLMDMDIGIPEGEIQIMPRFQLGASGSHLLRRHVVCYLGFRAQGIYVYP